MFPLLLQRVTAATTNDPADWLPGKFNAYRVELTWFDKNNAEFLRLSRTVEPVA